MFRLTCPRCGAEPDDARLKVVSGTFQAEGMLLQEDGFATMDARQFNTDHEMVRCSECEAVFPLGECLEENGPAPSFEPFRGWDWTELGARFGVAIRDEDDPAPLAAWLEEHSRLPDDRKWVARACREFVEALAAADPSYNKPVWEGLAKVEDDETFMGFVVHLLGWMWS